MSNSLSRAAVLLACVAGITAGVAQPVTAAPSPAEPAASAQPAPAQPAASQPAATTPAATAPAATQAAAKPKPVKKPAGPADVVVVVRTGGIAGGMSVFTLVGADNQHNAQTLRLASSPEFRALRPKYVPENTCCDRYTYKVEVGYRNGVKKKITVLQGTPGTPKVLLDVIRRMETMPTPEPMVVRGFPFD